MLQTKSKIVAAKSFRLFYFDILNTKLETDDDLDDDTDEQKTKVRIDDKQFVVQMYGINERGETASILVDDYKPFFYIKVGDEWTDNHAGKMISNIRREMGDYYKGSLIQYNIVDSQKLYGFTAGKKSKFVKLVFSNTVALNKVKNLWYKKMPDGSRRPCPFVPKTQLYESNLPPLLRFFHINHIAPNGWIMLSNRARACAVRTTTCTYEFVASQAQIKALPEKESLVPYKIMSFDIEAGSSHGDFPLPRKTYKRLAMNIMDALDRQRDVRLTPEIINEKLTKMILAAFGYGVEHGIDLVYPKSGVPDKKYVEMVTKEIINNKLSKLEVKNADASKLLTIDAMFAKANAPANYEDMDDGDNSDVEDVEDPDYDTDDEPSRAKAAQSSLKGVNITIANLIMSTDVERDKKVQYIDQALTESFPPLEGDPVTMIGSTFVKYGSAEPYLNHCIVLDGCESVEDATIEAVPIVGVTAWPPNAKCCCAGLRSFSARIQISLSATIYLGLIMSFYFGAQKKPIV